MSKYYTPSIEEFHVGFEYEFHGMSTGGFAIMDFKNNTIEQVSDPDIKIWDKCKVSTNPMFKRSLDSIENSIVSGQIRVKYLNQSDIESLGFELKRKSIDLWFEVSGSFRTPCDKYKISQYKLNYGLHDHRCKIECFFGGESEGVLFEGIIKNKSELKKILSWVGYMF